MAFLPKVSTFDSWNGAFLFSPGIILLSQVYNDCPLHWVICLSGKPFLELVAESWKQRRLEIIDSLCSAAGNSMKLGNYFRRIIFSGTSTSCLDSSSPTPSGFQIRHSFFRVLCMPDLIIDWIYLIIPSGECKNRQKIRTLALRVCSLSGFYFVN